MSLIDFIHEDNDQTLFEYVTLLVASAQKGYVKNGIGHIDNGIGLTEQIKVKQVSDDLISLKYINNSDIIGGQFSITESFDLMKQIVDQVTVGTTADKMKSEYGFSVIDSTTLYESFAPADTRNSDGAVLKNLLKDVPVAKMVNGIGKISVHGKNLELSMLGNSINVEYTDGKTVISGNFVHNTQNQNVLDTIIMSATLGDSVEDMLKDTKGQLHKQ